MRGYIHTIQDLEKLYYSGTPESIRYITKDDPMTSTTTGTYNPTYGAAVWAQLNQEANVFSALPKTFWNRSGVRVITARSAESGGGIAETGALPETTKPTIASYTATIKQIVHTFDSTMIKEFLVKESMDDDIGDMAFLRAYFGKHHKEMINIALCADASAEAAGAGADRTTTDKYNFESIDRLVSNDSEEDSFGGSYNGWFDWYDKDRDSATTGFEAYVSHNSGTDRPVSESLIRGLLYNCKEYGANTNIIFTGHDTYSAMQGVYAANTEYNVLGQAKVSIGVNGVQTANGTEFGIDVATINGIPVIVSKNVAKDTVSRIYALDTTDHEGMGEPALGIMMAKPVQYYESSDIFANNRMGTEGAYATHGELIGRFFIGQGKLRDLS